MKPSNKIKKDPIKFLLVGLDNSGKTSILISLRKDANILSYFSLKPTIGVSVEKFEDQNIVCWDLGGQKKYREEYLKNLGNYVKKTDKIIFVIDIQDVRRYDLALEYLNRIVNNLQKTNAIDFSIFLHKFDSDFEVNKNDIDQLIRKIKRVVPSNFKYSIHRTSIYATFEKTLLP